MVDLDSASLGSRLDRLPWSARHTQIALALGAGWLFDSLEVNLVGGFINPMERHFGVGPLVGVLPPPEREWDAQHDHETDDDAETMEQLERDILARLGIPDPYA